MSRLKPGTRSADTFSQLASQEVKCDYPKLFQNVRAASQHDAQASEYVGFLLRIHSLARRAGGLGTVELGQSPETDCGMSVSEVSRARSIDLPNGSSSTFQPCKTANETQSFSY